MPKVGGKKFPYTGKGKKAAKAYAEKTSQSVKKYYGGGSVDPFSSRNPEGVVSKLIEEKANILSGEEGSTDMPTTNAKDRSQTMPDTEQYNKGGKVKSKKVDVTDIVKDVSLREGMIKGAIPKAYYDWEHGLRSGEIKRKKKEILKGKKK